MFGEIIAVAEPDFNLSISPIADALMLNNPLPSPLNNDAVIEPLIFVLAVISSVVLEATDFISVTSSLAASADVIVSVLELT